MLAGLQKCAWPVAWLLPDLLAQYEIELRSKTLWSSRLLWEGPGYMGSYCSLNQHFSNCGANDTWQVGRKTLIYQWSHHAPRIHSHSSVRWLHSFHHTETMHMKLHNVSFPTVLFASWYDEWFVRKLALDLFCHFFAHWGEQVGRENCSLSKKGMTEKVWKPLA